MTGVRETSAAFDIERLLVAMRPKLHRYCARMVGSVIDGEDVLQDTLIKAVESFSSAGPIGNPGLASLRAAAHPAHTHYLFYVVKPGTCGEHSFSSTDAQFQRDVNRYNAARAKKGGKSPTTC